MEKNKKAQIYGLNAFLFSLAIAIILIVALVGTTKEFENASRAGMYRVSSIMAMRSAEQFKSFVDQERRYAFDKSLFMTGAYGGYLAYRDLIGTTFYSTDSSSGGCPTLCTGLESLCPGYDAASAIPTLYTVSGANSAITGCPYSGGEDPGPGPGPGPGPINGITSETEPITTKSIGDNQILASSEQEITPEEDLSGETVILDPVTATCPGEEIVAVNAGSCYCYRDSGAYGRYFYTIPISDIPADNYCYNTPLGGKSTNASYSPEKVIPYWKKYNSISLPDVSFIQENVIDYATRPFARSHETITNAISVFSEKYSVLNYILEIKEFDQNNIETIWFPIGNTKFTIDYPPGEPVASYTFSPFVHSKPQTKFFDVYAESKKFVEEDPLEDYFFSLDGGVFPLVIDNRYLSKRANESGEYTFPLPSPRESFKSLVKRFNNSAIYPDHPDCPLNCNATFNSLDIYNYYSGTCRINMTKDSTGKLTILDGQWVNCSHGNTATQNAMKCIMWRIASKINYDLGLGAPDSNWKPPIDEGTRSSLGWNFDFDWFVVKLKPPVTTDTFYNTSIGENPDDDCQSCVSPNIIGGHHYAKKDLTIEPHYVQCYKTGCGVLGYPCTYKCIIQPEVKFSAIQQLNTYGVVDVSMRAKFPWKDEMLLGTPKVIFDHEKTISSGGYMEINVHEWAFGWTTLKFCLNASGNYPGDLPPYCVTFEMKKDENNGFLPNTFDTNVTGTIDMSSCGNGTCDGLGYGEDYNSCIVDCYCGNTTSGMGDGLCNASYCCDETTGQCSLLNNADVASANCPTDLKRFDSNENFGNCPQDCTTCGNLICDAGENFGNCPQDCLTCGNGTCDIGENITNCPEDCLYLPNVVLTECVDLGANIKNVTINWTEHTLAPSDATYKVYRYVFDQFREIPDSWMTYSSCNEYAPGLFSCKMTLSYGPCKYPNSFGSTVQIWNVAMLQNGVELGSARTTCGDSGINC